MGCDSFQILRGSGLQGLGTVFRRRTYEVEAESDKNS